MKPCAHTSSDLASPCRLLQDSAVQWSPGCGRDPTHAELSYWCHKRSCIVVQPQLTEVAFLQLMELMHVAGYQRAKARGTFQQREILQIAAAGGELGDYLNTNLAHTRGDGKHVNIYINLNEGKSGGGDQCGDAGETDIFHTDTPSEGASIRCFNYFLPVGKVAGLKVRYGRTVLLIEVGLLPAWLAAVRVATWPAQLTYATLIPTCTRCTASLSTSRVYRALYQCTVVGYSYARCMRAGGSRVPNTFYCKAVSYRV